MESFSSSKFHRREHLIHSSESFLRRLASARFFLDVKSTLWWIKRLRSFRLPFLTRSLNSFILSHETEIIDYFLNFVFPKFLGVLHLLNSWFHLMPLNLINHVVIVPFLYDFILQFSSFIKCKFFRWESLQK